MGARSILTQGIFTSVSSEAPQHWSWSKAWRQDIRHKKLDDGILQVHTWSCYTHWPIKCKKYIRWCGLLGSSGKWFRWFMTTLLFWLTCVFWRKRFYGRPQSLKMRCPKALMKHVEDIFACMVSIWIGRSLTLCHNAWRIETSWMAVEKMIKEIKVQEGDRSRSQVKQSGTQDQVERGEENIAREDNPRIEDLSRVRITKKGSLTKLSSVHMVMKSLEAGANSNDALGLISSTWWCCSWWWPWSSRDTTSPWWQVGA